VSSALRRHAEGEPLDVADLPFRLQVALVAARHGTRPADVRAWPVAEFLDAMAVLTVGR